METTRVERSAKYREGDILLYKAGDLWKFGISNAPYKFEDDTPYKFEDLPQRIKEPLSVLLTTAVGYYNEHLGRRVSEDVFWVYHE